MKIVVHPGTGTVIDADECYLLDTETDLTEDEVLQLADNEDYFDEVIICDIVESLGTKLTELLEGAK